MFKKIFFILTMLFTVSAYAGEWSWKTVKMPYPYNNTTHHYSVVMLPDQPSTQYFRVLSSTKLVSKSKLKKVRQYDKSYPSTLVTVYDFNCNRLVARTLAEGSGNSRSKAITNLKDSRLQNWYPLTPNSIITNYRNFVCRNF